MNDERAILTVRQKYPRTTAPTYFNPFGTFTSSWLSSRDTVALPVARFIVQRETGRPIVISILPVDGAARSPVLGASALLTMTDLELKPRLDPEVLSGITPSQARLAAFIATGKSLEEVANKLGIALETARNQLKERLCQDGHTTAG